MMEDTPSLPMKHEDGLLMFRAHVSSKGTDNLVKTKGKMNAACSRLIRLEAMHGKHRYLDIPTL